MAPKVRYRRRGLSKLAMVAKIFETKTLFTTPRNAGLMQKTIAPSVPGIPGGQTTQRFKGPVLIEIQKSLLLRLKGAVVGLSRDMESCQADKTGSQGRHILFAQQAAVGSPGSACTGSLEATADDAGGQNEAAPCAAPNETGQAGQEPAEGAETHPLSHGNNVIVARVMRFIREVNEILEKGLDGQDAPLEKDSACTTSAGSKQHANPPGHTEVTTSPRTVLADTGILHLGKAIGISSKGNGLLELNSSFLASLLSSNKDEILSVIHDFGNRLTEKMDVLINPYISPYAFGRKMALTTAAPHDDEMPFLEQQLAAKQNSLNDRLKELGLLIEQSTVLRDWFTHKKQNTPVDFEVVQ